MTGGAALARQLRAQGVEVIFGLPGDQLMAALDALVDVPEIRYIVTRHEQATTYMADGYARAGGRPGVAMVVPGVGVYNAASGLATAYACSSPVLLIAGQVNRDGIGRDLGLLHDLHDQLDVVRPITKSARRVLDPAEIPAAVREAFHVMTSGRQRPVEIEIPPETFAETAAIELLAPIPADAATVDLEALERAAEVLAASASPRDRGRRGSRARRRLRRVDRGRGAVAGAGDHHARGQGRDRRSSPAVGRHDVGELAHATGDRRRRRGAGGGHPLPGIRARRRAAADPGRRRS